MDICAYGGHVRSTHSHVHVQNTATLLTVDNQSMYLVYRVHSTLTRIQTDTAQAQHRHNRQSKPISNRQVSY